MRKSWPFALAVIAVGGLAGVAIAGRPVPADEFVLGPSVTVPVTDSTTTTGPGNDHGAARQRRRRCDDDNVRVDHVGRDTGNDDHRRGADHDRCCHHDNTRRTTAARPGAARARQR
jgi:hypothetical protein